MAIAKRTKTESKTTEATEAVTLEQALKEEGEGRTPETVAQAMLEYYKLGAKKLLIRGYDPLPDAIEYGEELIPRLRELVAEYDASQ